MVGVQPLRNALVVFFLTLPYAHTSLAGEANVVSVKVDCVGKSVCEFAVAVRHSDEGWNHYADRWEVLTPDGKILAARILRHPHVDEQPFWRRLSGVKIPKEVTWVRVRAHDSVHGYGGKEIEAGLPR